MARFVLDEELAALAGLSPAQLREKWSELTRRPVPRVSAKLLRLALAWELQAKVHGGLSRRTIQKLDKLAAAKTVTRELSLQPSPCPRRKLPLAQSLSRSPSA